MGYKDTLAEIERLRKVAFAEAGVEFGNNCKAIFEKHPKLEQFSWTQYTPYFNDGEECTFSAHTEYVKMTFDGEEHEEVSKWDLKRANSDLSAECKAAIKDVMAFMEQFDEDDLKEMFGDHKEVVVTAKGAVAEDYDHD